MVEARRTLGARIVRVTKRVLLFILVTVAVLLGAGAIWNAVALHHNRSIAGIPGKIYQVDGHAMQMLCTGSGSPVVLLEAGLGNDSMIWGKNQPELSKITKVCAYDRAGFGWSDPVPGVRDSNAISHELHGLLEQAGITGPIILMGHSIAGIHMRNYAAHYPENIAGIVFIDGSTPQQDKYFPASIEKKQEQFVKILFPLAKAATATGVLRALGQCTAVTKGMEAYAAWIKADSCAPSQITSVEREMKGVPASGDESVNTGPFGSTPILIFSQDPTMHNARLGDEGGKELSGIWNGMQENLKKLSTNSRRIIAKGSTHYVQVDRSDMLNREVTKFIGEVRSGAVSPQNGTTVTE